MNFKFENGDNLSNDELQGLIAQLLAGGNETTTSSIAHGLWLLLQHPDQMEKLIENPDLLPNFVEEVIRFETPVQGLLELLRKIQKLMEQKYQKEVFCW